MNFISLHLEHMKNGMGMSRTQNCLVSNKIHSGEKIVILMNCRTPRKLCIMIFSFQYSYIYKSVHFNGLFTQAPRQETIQYLAFRQLNGE